MPNIMLAVGNYASKPYAEDDNQVIKRFAAVFEQSYTRFLDLQKAEAQAREAQIRKHRIGTGYEPTLAHAEKPMSWQRNTQLYF